MPSQNTAFAPKFRVRSARRVCYSIVMILAGDIGGTNSRFAFLELREGVPRFLWSKTWPSRERGSLVELVRLAVSESGLVPDAASFGVAGPVMDGRVQTTNLPWAVEATELARELGLERVGLLNDLEANAWGLGLLGNEAFQLVQAGAAGARGNRALIAAGTGLGEAGLYFDGERHLPFACEGGHASFAPSDALEEELLVHLRGVFGHVSWERVLSGPGLLNLYLFLRDTGRAVEDEALARELTAGDPAAAISRAALTGRSELATRALELFVRLYGSQAGNLALTVMATGGVYLGGGIAPKIAAWIGRPEFTRAFVSKGRMRSVLERIPVRIVLDDRTALLGAGLYGSGAQVPARRA
jgi:glucokinase